MLADSGGVDFGTGMFSYDFLNNGVDEKLKKLLIDHELITLLIKAFLKLIFGYPVTEHQFAEFVATILKVFGSNFIR